MDLIGIPSANVPVEQERCWEWGREQVYLNTACDGQDVARRHAARGRLRIESGSVFRPARPDSNTSKNPRGETMPSVRCQWTWNPGHWPYVARCGEEGTAQAH